MSNYVKSTAIVAASLLFCFLIISVRSSYGSLYLELVIFSLSLFALVKSASVFTQLALHVGNYLGISKLATGILIIAIGTSAPELFASIGAVIQGQPEMVVGNVFGTIVANSLLGIGAGALAAKTALTVHKEVIGTQMSVFLAAICLALGSLYDGVLSWFEGAVLLAVLAFYLHHVVKTSNGADSAVEQEDEAKTKEHPIPFLIIFLLLNLSGLFVSGDFVVSSLIEGAKILDFSSVKLATSILAVGTSIPEIATAIALVRQNNADSLFGEIIGSNIFDVLGIFGLLSLFTPLTMGSGLLLYLGGSVFVMFIITNTIMNDREINRLEGVSLIALFAVFTYQLVNL